MDFIETITAIATPRGRGGIGIIRLSGPKSLVIAQKIADAVPQPGQFIFTALKNQNNQRIDQGLVLYFKAPHSFTGEDVVEFQTHGSPIVLDILLETAVHYGARLASAGEFSERAFLNNKIDLTQAEAIA
jgi:tRNA modification GTPase